MKRFGARDRGVPAARDRGAPEAVVSTHQRQVLANHSKMTLDPRFLKDIFRLGWPMFIGQLAVMANGFIDTIMAGRYSTLDLAGIGVGSSIFMSICPM